MIVRLTPGQWSFLRQINFPDEIHDALDRGTHDVGASKVVAIPYIAWAIVRERLTFRAFTQTGAREPSAPQRLSTVLRVIQTSINVRDRHPALRSASAIGRQVELIPAWEIVGGRSPRPGQGRFVVLEPQSGSRIAGEFTWWRAREPGPGDDWLCQERSHLTFWAEATRTLGWGPNVDAAGVQ